MTLSREQPPSPPNLDSIKIIASTCILASMLMLDLLKVVTVDVWTIVLLLMIVVPWTYESIFAILASLGDVFSRANLASLEIGKIKIQRLETKVDAQALELDHQRSIIDDLVLYTMAFHIYKLLRYLTLGTTVRFRDTMNEFIYHQNEPFDHDLRYLRDHGYLEHFQISSLVDGENLVGRIKVTENGRRFVELREERQARLTPMFASKLP